MKDHNAAVAAEPPLALPLLMAACSSNRERPRLILPPAHSLLPSQIRIVLCAGVADDCSRNTRVGEKQVGNHRLVSAVPRWQGAAVTRITADPSLSFKSCHGKTSISP